MDAARRATSSESRSCSVRPEPLSLSRIFLAGVGALPLRYSIVIGKKVEAIIASMVI